MSNGTRKPSREMMCENCGKIVLVPHYRIDSFRFCSRGCLYQKHAREDRVNVVCNSCTQVFSVIKLRAKTARYCSSACYRRSMKGRGSVVANCTVCGKELRRPPSRSNYQNLVCDKVCRGLLKRSTKPGGSNTYRLWMERRGLVDMCNRCGYSEHKEILVVHHRNRDREDNLPENLEVLCPNCHAIEHYVNK